jgi:hypothetical protein
MDQSTVGSPTMNSTLEQRRWIIEQKKNLASQQLLLDEYERTQNAYDAMMEADAVFEQRKAAYLQEEAQYESLGASTQNPNATGATTNTAYNPSVNNAPLPGQGLPYYQPLPSEAPPLTANGQSPYASGYGSVTPQNLPSPQGVPTQASLQQQAQNKPAEPTAQDVATLRQILEMNPQTAQQAKAISDADLMQLLKSDPEIAGAVKEFQAMSAQGGTQGGTNAPQGAGSPSNANATTPTDPAQALKLAQQDPQMMKQVQSSLVASMTPQERDAMMKQLANDPEAQAILAQMGVAPSAQAQPQTAPAQKQTAPAAVR